MKIKSALLTEASGSIGGMTASHNAGGLYLRARTIPVDPSTAQQQVVRNALAEFSSAWVETLSATPRADWLTYSQNVPLVDRLGDPRSIPPLAHYVRSNVPRRQAGLDPVNNAPTIYDLGTFSPPSIVIASATTANLTFTNTDDWANEANSCMLIYCSTPQNQTVEFFKGPYRYLDLVYGNASTPPTSPQLLTFPFTVATGTKVFFQVRVTRADGRLSSTFRTSDVR